MKHTFNLRAEPFDAVRFGYKTIELRLYDEKRRRINVGDEIEFIHNDDSYMRITKTVAALHVFDSFEELYDSLPLLKCGYTPFDLRDAKAEDMESYYPAPLQKKNKVVGIEFKEEPLQRFTAGQTGAMPYCSSYETALDEIKNGHKDTHWIWYVFPQLKGLTPDPVTEYYAVTVNEAREFLAHPVLGKRLIEITKALLALDGNDPVTILGQTDAYKLRASMTLFYYLTEGSEEEHKVFGDVLEKFCMGMTDPKTRALVK